MSVPPLDRETMAPSGDPASNGAPLGPRPHPWLRAMAPYVPGKARADSGGPVVKLSSNESVFGPSPDAIAAYRACAPDLWRYPDGDPAVLRAAIGAAHGLPGDQILCGNGSDELLMLLVQAYAGPGDEIIHCRHGFSLYPILARAVGARSVAVPNRADLSPDPDAIARAVTAKTRIVLLDNPNNPTGGYAPWAAVQALHRALPGDVLLVLDAAYAESVSAAEYGAGDGLVAQAANVVMTRTLSKLYGLAALRLGWLYGPPAIVDTLNRLRAPFNVNAAAQAAAQAALADQTWLGSVKAKTVAGRDRLSAGLAALGLHVAPSQTNFVLVRLASPKTAQAALAHLARHGILVRHLPGQGLDDCLRITVGTEADINAVLGVLGDFMASGQAA